jgi:cytochrome b subunit of formate dehydrogenase
MSFVTWGASPWGEPVILHAAWDLLWFSLAAGVLLALAHAVFVRLASHGPDEAVSADQAAGFPERIQRHSLPARLFHWVMAAAMLTLLTTAFLPKLGVRFDWVGVHMWAGIVLIAAIAFHVIHALCCMDFRSVWPTPADLNEIKELGKGNGQAGPKYRPGKYPLGNKLYHLALIVVGLTMAITGLLMLTRLQTPLIERDPYRFFGDGGWGVIYALHGLAGLSLAALVIVHVYFALRPEKRPITLSMIVGTMDRKFYLAHYDPARWSGEGPTAQ